VDEVRLVNPDERQAHVLVPDDQLSLAIGKEGQNVRLAARLTGWKIDIKDSAKYDYESENRKIAELAEERHLAQAAAAEETEEYDDDEYDDDEYDDEEATPVAAAADDLESDELEPNELEPNKLKDEDLADDSEPAASADGFGVESGNALQRPE
jgi:N utilization substance protein A